MRFTKVVEVENKVFGEDIVRSIAKYFERLLANKKGSIDISVQSPEYGEISGDNQEVIDISFAKSKPVSRVKFTYESDDYKSELWFSIQDRFVLGSYGGANYTISSDDENWFNIVRVEMQDLMDSVPTTPLVFRFLNTWGWLVSTLISVFFVFSVFRIVFRYFLADVKFPQWADGLIVVAFFILIGGGFECVKEFLRRNYPIIDLDIFKNRKEVRDRVSKTFWWIVGTIGAMLISTYLPLPFNSRTNPPESKASRQVLTPVTNVTVTTLNSDCPAHVGNEIKQEQK